MVIQERLKELFEYNPDTGSFTRLVYASPNAQAGDLAGTINVHGYHVIQVDGTLHYAHRLAWLYTHGVWPIDQIDHINHNRSDNRIENLREADDSLNRRNQSISRRNTSGYQNVTKNGSGWSVTVSTEYFGTFKTKEEANVAAEDARASLGYHINHGK